MRRGGGHYGGAGDSSAGNAYSQIQHHPQHGRPEEHQQQWRWERESPKLPTNAMSPHMFSEGQGAETSRPHYQGQRTDPRMLSENQGGKDLRSQPRPHYQGQRTDPRMLSENQGGKDLRSQPVVEDMDIGYEDNPMPQSREGLEQKFLDDIMKLSKEQNDAEDAENARHREQINAINAQYQEQLVALRARHASRREDVLRRESHARRQQYQQQAALDNHPNTNTGPIDPHGYGLPPPLPGERQRAYNANNYDSYRERSRFPGRGRGRDHGYEPRLQYPPGGRGYDTSSRYY